MNRVAVRKADIRAGHADIRPSGVKGEARVLAVRRGARAPAEVGASDPHRSEPGHDHPGVGRGGRQHFGGVEGRVQLGGNARADGRRQSSRQPAYSAHQWPGQPRRSSSRAMRGRRRKQPARSEDASGSSPSIQKPHASLRSRQGIACQQFHEPGRKRGRVLLPRICQNDTNPKAAAASRCLVRSDAASTRRNRRFIHRLLTLAFMNIDWRPGKHGKFFR